VEGGASRKVRNDGVEWRVHGYNQLKKSGRPVYLRPTLRVTHTNWEWRVIEKGRKMSLASYREILKMKVWNKNRIIYLLSLSVFYPV